MFRSLHASLSLFLELSSLSRQRSEDTRKTRVSPTQAHDNLPKESEVLAWLRVFCRDYTFVLNEGPRIEKTNLCQGSNQGE